MNLDELERILGSMIGNIEDLVYRELPTDEQIAFFHWAAEKLEIQAATLEVMEVFK